MPHVKVKIVSKTEEEKLRFAAAITQAVMDALQAAEAYIPVPIIDVAKADWLEQVYKPDILGHLDSPYKKPGYHPLD